MGKTMPVQPSPPVQPVTLSKHEQAMADLDRRRHLKDRLANALIAGGGIFVLVAILAIFVYLVSESWPLFKPSHIEKAQAYQTTTQQVGSGFVELEEFNQSGMRLSPAGQIQIFNVADGKTLQTIPVNIPTGVTITHVQRSGIMQGLIGLGLSNGQLIVIKPSFAAQGLGADRKTTATINYPYGEAPLTVDDQKLPLRLFDLRDDEGALQVLTVANGQLQWQRYAKAGANAEGALGGGLALDADMGGDAAVATTTALVRQTNVGFPVSDINSIKSVHIGQGGRWLFAVNQNGTVDIFNNTDTGLVKYDQVRVDQDGAITATAMLQGEISLLLGTDKGKVDQWFLVRGTDAKQHMTLTKIRSFDVGNSPITVIQPESRRKGFMAGDQAGNVGYFYTTSERNLGTAHVSDAPITALTMSTHSEGMLVDSAKGSSFWAVDAKHPEVSWGSLWGKVWYESYQKPDYVWQSTSGNVDFESKMSLVPLTFGTIKAAFWAMLLAAPLAIAGAMYTAAFMSASLRTKIKPAIELMQALPTVILGFLAGLWLAPLVTKYLPAIFSVLVIVPIVIFVVGFLWMQMPLEKRNRLPQGIAPLVLILPIVLAVTAAFMLSQPFEHAVFANYDGSMLSWLHAKGIDYQSQNALIVGLIMGFAVIAPIFSISEDALFAVPRHLVNGSLALGATPWQTLMTVILPTASPGIFSAVMIGFGRAVGETMIVLMATGNTPIMDLSLFDGMRTLSANVAVEMGEAEVGSTHFRVLFLSALVLFIMTFVLNTIAELVRARLRKKFGSL